MAEPSIIAWLDDEMGAAYTAEELADGGGFVPLVTLADWQRTESARSEAEEECERLRQAMKKQASSAITGMNAAKATAIHLAEHATQLYAQCNPDVLDSEREANAALTAENEMLRAQLAEHTRFMGLMQRTEAEWINDARRSGFERAREMAIRECEMYETAEGENCALDIRAMPLPAEWLPQGGAEPAADQPKTCASAESSPVLNWPHPDGFGGGLMEER